MFYRVKALSTKNRPWKVQVISYADGARKERDLKPDELLQKGFYPGMTLEEAQKRRDQLNAQEKDVRHDERRAAIKKRLAQEETTFSAWLPTDDIAEFESEVLYDRFDDDEFIKKNKIESHWRAAKRCLCAVKLDPSEWHDRRARFYDYFAKNRVSLAYVKKLLRIINMWGSFHSRKYRRYFDPVPFPTGIEKERIADRYFDKTGAGEKESDPLTPEMLAEQKATLETNHYNWLLLSVWFGLRPGEVESLRSSKYFRIETHEGKAVLFVYQNKLKNIPREKRWKYIPCLYKEQEHCLRVIATGNFGRPSLKVVHSRFGDGVHYYGGRKAFESLMDELGHDFFDVSLWLGHQDIGRTWKSYVNKQKVRIPGKRKGPSIARK